MTSRINIGPEDGPYVAINESSGNLQLEDNSGNVVAEWDETNSQWDFANNTLNNIDALNSNSVNTEEGRITGPISESSSLVKHVVYHENLNNDTIDIDIPLPENPQNRAGAQIYELTFNYSMRSSEGGQVRLTFDDDKDGNWRRKYIDGTSIAEDTSEDSLILFKQSRNTTVAKYWFQIRGDPRFSSGIPVTGTNMGVGGADSFSRERFLTGEFGVTIDPDTIQIFEAGGLENGSTVGFVNLQVIAGGNEVIP